jgi:DNA polymerase-3 subunit delta
MLIFVYGDDTFRVQEKVKELREAFAKKFDPTGLNFSSFLADGKKLEPGPVVQAITSMPFLGEKRMVILRDVLSQTKKELDEAIVNALENVPTSTIVVLWETLPPADLEKKPLFKTLKSGAEVHHYPYPLLEGAKLQQWTAMRIKELGATIAPDALVSIIERVGSDLWQMNAEIEKLAARADGEMITKAMVEEMVRASFDDQIFALVDAVAARQSNLALRLLEEERLSGAADGYILSMLIRQIRLLLGARAMLDENPRASQAEFAALFGVHPFVAGKAMKQARAFALDGLKATHAFLYNLELGLKTGRYKDDLAADLATVAFMKP